VEIAKQELAEGGSRAVRAADTLARVFDMALRLLHPFTPFVTEEIWGHLRETLLDSPLANIAADWPKALIVARWPEPRDPEGWEDARVADFALIQEIVRSIRNLRAEKNLPPAKKLPATIVGGAKTDLLTEQSKVIASLAGLDYSQLSILSSLDAKPEGAAALVVGAVEIYIPLAGAVDSAGEKSRLEKELKEAGSHIERLEKLLSSDFANKAPAAVIAKEREKLAGYKETAEKIKSQLQ
jgi:valyl-tRNA synthetase